MANSTANLNITTTLGHNFNYTMSTSYDEIFQVRQEVDNSNGFIDLVKVGKSIAAQTLRDAKMVVVHNTGDTVLEIQVTIQGYKNNSNEDVVNSVDLGGGATALRYINFLLPAGEFLYLPNNRVISYEGEAGVSACNATAITDVLPHDINSGNEYVDSTANLGEDLDATEIVVTTSDGDFFRVGDLIQCGTNPADGNADEIEIMRVTDISGNDLTVERALFGTQAGTSGTQSTGHVNGANIYFPHFNEYHDFDRYSTAQTDYNGRFKASNFFGYGRNDDTISDGLVPGSIAIGFYKKPYQDLGINGITSSSDSGLTGGTTYEFHVDVTGTDEDVTFTVDSSNTNFGGTNGVLRKIQDALDLKYYNSSSQLFEKQISVSIVNGDLRFTLNESLSTSKIEVGRAADLSGSTHLFNTSSTFTGRFPGVDDIPTYVAPQLPRPKRITGGFSSQVRKNVDYIYDDGNGNLSGAGGSGIINYDTGAIDFTGNSNSHFVVTASYKSALGGSGDGSTSNAVNVINNIAARSTSSKKDGVCSVIAMN